MEAAEWAERKVGQIGAKREAEMLRDQLNLKRQQLRESHFQALTESVFNAFCCGCKEYNKRRASGDSAIEFHIGRISILKRDAGWSEIWVERNPGTLSIRVRANQCSFRFDRTYRPEPLADGTVVLFCRETQSLSSPEDVALGAIDVFLDGREWGERL